MAGRVPRTLDLERGGWIPACPNLLGALNKSLPLSEPSFLPGEGSGGGFEAEARGWHVAHN